METREFTLLVNLPTVEEFADKYKTFGGYARNKANFLFERIVSPDSFVYAKVATELELPAVAGIADICYKLVIENGSIPWENFTKQFIGAVVCKLMEDNGYIKYKSKSVPHPKFTKGEFYQLAHK